MNKKQLLILLLSLMLIVFISNFFISKNYNKLENIEKRAIKYCIKNGNEYRETAGSDGKNLKQCKINDKFVNVIEYYKLNNK